MEGEVHKLSLPDFIKYDYKNEFTIISVLKISSDMRFMKQMIRNWLECHDFVIRNEIQSDREFLEYMPLFIIEGYQTLPSFSLCDTPMSHSSTIADDGSESDEGNLRWIWKHYDDEDRSLTIHNPTVDDQDDEPALAIENRDVNMVPESTIENRDVNMVPELAIENKDVKIAPTLGIEGEEYVFNILTSTFPTYENVLVSGTAHVADIHSTDLDNKILYVYEVKNKKQLTAEDLDKFDRDIEDLKRQHPDMKVIGIFTSINCPIPKYGHISIDIDKCYLSTAYVNSECLKLVVSMYSRILTKIEKPVDKVAYEVPTSVYKLLAELKSQYNDVINNKYMFEEQIKMNKKSNEYMYDLLAKTNLQISFINYLNNEFKDINDDPVTVQQLRNVDEEKLITYIRNTPKSRITKKYLLDNFPSITKLRTMKLSDIILSYQ